MALLHIMHSWVIVLVYRRYIVLISFQTWVHKNVGVIEERSELKIIQVNPETQSLLTHANTRMVFSITCARVRSLLCYIVMIFLFAK